MSIDALQSNIDALSLGFRRLKGIGDNGDASSEEIAFDEWDWEVGVGLYGEARAALEQKDTAKIARLERWYDWQIGRGLPRPQVNSTAPLLALSILAKHNQRDDWCRVIEDWATWLVNEMPKTEEGGFQHTVKERDNDRQLWDDTLFMAVLFLASAGELLDRQDWIDEAHYQFLTHVRHLGDVQSGLFFHGWNFIGRHHYARALWARGNAWLTIAIPELFRISPPNAVIARYLTEVLQTQVKALQDFQGPNGMFHTLLDDPQSPVEASGTAGIAYGVLASVRLGLLDESYLKIVEQARAAIQSRIGDDGFLQDVSDGTPMGPDLDFYRKIPNLPTPYGQALGSLFLLELQRHEASQA
ncbi:Unsaturated rhamnogalacturonyl hydrolase YesR [Pelagimonas phthalicica]|uniref:Unsaturated rhamnogalacturonyl hydrolase YesR n=1 Tax=Pelagimonas phthalicica TaxID=1037362 RepID=A0A238J8C6_9RHOB|nr:glycoside hydrolase family 88 protein [Pelagimonas phthalicica]TDS95047.1 unsaturated rhamnogalacturonyl hydrolase [Pelagimonas phthalicica]SMX26427.1 Unsaturated rhamnogalacturonyl hydrolase YesR [Pelagimonas phthalicica]